MKPGGSKNWNCSKKKGKSDFTAFLSVKAAGTAKKWPNGGMVDTIQVIYNIFNQHPAGWLFPHCEKNNIGILARVPFDEGALTGKFNVDTKFAEGDFRNSYFPGRPPRGGGPPR